MHYNIENNNRQIIPETKEGATLCTGSVVSIAISLENAACSEIHQMRTAKIFAALCSASTETLAPYSPPLQAY